MYMTSFGIWPRDEQLVECMPAAPEHSCLLNRRFIDTAELYLLFSDIAIGGNACLPCAVHDMHECQTDSNATHSGLVAFR